MKQREPCGCTHDGARWLSMCEPHARECEEKHAAAMARVSWEPGRLNYSQPVAPSTEPDPWS